MREEILKYENAAKQLEPGTDTRRQWFGQVQEYTEQFLNESGKDLASND